MENAKKITKLETVELMLADEMISSNEIYKAYLENEKAILERKKANKKATKTQTENESLKAEIVEIMRESGKAYTIGDLIKSSPTFADFSTPKMSALVKALKDNGVVTRTVEKGKAYFSLTD